MSIRRKKSLGLVTVVVAGAVAMGGYAFTASNTVPSDSNAGFGVAATPPSGYVVSTIAYTLNGTDPRNVDAVTFNLDKTATVVKARFDSATTNWYACTVGPLTAGKYPITCNTTVGTQLTAVNVNAVEVVATTTGT